MRVCDRSRRPPLQRAPGPALGEEDDPDAQSLKGDCRAMEGVEISSVPCALQLREPDDARIIEISPAVFGGHLPVGAGCGEPL